MASPSNNLDCDNNHSLTQSAAASPDSPASCAATEDSNPLTQEGPRPDKLHLIPCTLDVYLELPNKAEDRYELVEGILLHRSNMADSKHTVIKEYLVAKFRGVERSDNERVNVYTETKVQVGARRGKPVVRIPDVIVGPYVSSEGINNASPRSKKMLFTIDKKPLMVIEITSPSNRMTDIKNKSKEYYGLEIGLYIIVDREISLDHPHGCVRVRKRSTSNSRARIGYSETVYEGNTVVDCLLFRERNLTAVMVLNPPQTAEEAAQSPTKRERARASAAEGRASAAEGRASAAEAALANLQQEVNGKNKQRKGK